jgi:hypothetical protein
MRVKIHDRKSRMTDDEIEAVAHAFYDLEESARGWEREPDVLKDCFRKKAFAAILAINEDMGAAPAEDLSVLKSGHAGSRHLDTRPLPTCGNPRAARQGSATSRSRRSDEGALVHEPTGFLAVTSGPRHVFHLANQAFRRLVGQQRLIGRTMLHALPDLHQQGFVNLLDRVYKTREPFIGSSMQITVRSQSHSPWREHAVDLVLKPLEAIDGKHIGIVMEGRELDRATGLERLAN